MSVAPPSQGLGSNFNYFLADGGNAITGLNVEITFAEPLISTSNGFGFQLNGYARKHHLDSPISFRFYLYTPCQSTRPWNFYA